MYLVYRSLEYYIDLLFTISTESFCHYVNYKLLLAWTIEW